MEKEKLKKRIFYPSQRAADILSRQQERAGFNLSAFISDAVLDEALPCYSSLRVEALHLLDVTGGRAHDWVGGQIVALGESQSEQLDYLVRQTLSRGLAWLRDGHHIQSRAVFDDIAAMYSDVELSFERLDGNIQTDSMKIFEQLKGLGILYETPSSLVEVLEKVLLHWSDLWDFDGAYDFFISLALCQKPLRELEPFAVCQYLQRFETCFILQALGEQG